MKTKNDKEVLDYLKPYMETDGLYLPKQVMVEYKDIIVPHMVVKVDVKSSFVKKKGEAIKSFLRKQGFLYNVFFDAYQRKVKKR